MYLLPECCHPMARRQQYSFFWAWSRHKALRFLYQFLWQIAIMHKSMQFARCSLNAHMYSIAGGMCSEPFEPISIQMNFPSCGNWFKIGFTLLMTINSMIGEQRSREMLMYPRALLNTLPRNGSSILNKEVWSTMLHQNRTIFEEGDTNMLLESYVFMLFLDILIY